MKIELVKNFTRELYGSVVAILPQLDPEIKPPSAEFFMKFLASEYVDFFVAGADDNQIAGMLTLVRYPNITGMKFWIEDVVVDSSFRGKGIGEKLTVAAIERARELGAKEVKLTSRPFREAANKLYQKLGFVQYETNVYKLKLS